MKRLILVVALASGAFAASPAEAQQHPQWISGCVAWKWSSSARGFSAKCTSGNARYFARATCYKPKVGSTTAYGTYVWPGTRSDGQCPVGYMASNPGWTQ